MKRLTPFRISSTIPINSSARRRLRSASPALGMPAIPASSAITCWFKLRRCFRARVFNAACSSSGKSRIVNVAIHALCHQMASNSPPKPPALGPPMRIAVRAKHLSRAPRKRRAPARPAKGGQGVPEAPCRPALLRTNSIFNRQIPLKLHPDLPGSVINLPPNVSCPHDSMIFLWKKSWEFTIYQIVRSETDEIPIMSPPHGGADGNEPQTRNNSEMERSGSGG